MKGFELYNGNQDFRIIDGTRTVLTTEGTLINLLPPAYDINITRNIVFPDFSKDYLYAWGHLFVYFANGNHINYDSFCNTQLTIPAQEFADEINLMAAPASSDIFVGSLVLTRIAAPSHTWNGTPIDPLQPMGVRIPFVSGSLLVEAEFGMVRAFSIYVAGGQLKLHRQQSVSTPPGGWGFFGDSFSPIARNSGGGGENVNGGTQGIPVLQVDLKNVAVIDIANSPIAPTFDTRTRRGGPDACAIPNPASYNYGSTYQAVLTGAFGRRS